MKDGADGFALLETVVAAALLALLFAIYLPSVLRAPGQAQFQADMTQAMSVLRTARAAAQTSQRDVMVAFDPARHALVSSGARAATIHPRTSVELRATGSAAAAEGITFFASGRSSGGEIHLTRDQLAGALRVNWVNGDVARAR